MFRSGQYVCDMILETEHTLGVKAVFGRLRDNLSGGGVCAFCFPAAPPSGA